jgi:hypothetical protein
VAAWVVVHVCFSSSCTSIRESTATALKSMLKATPLTRLLFVLFALRRVGGSGIDVRGKSG